VDLQTQEGPVGAALHAVAFRRPQPIADGIAAVLRDRIAMGVYAPGSWIREGVLGDEFGVSNGPIREALQLLVNEELLVREPGRGVRVVSLSGPEIVEVFQLRLALLELAAELAARRVTPAQLAQARALIAPMKGVLAAGDIDAQMPIGNHLNQWLCACSGNSRLANTYMRLMHQSRMYIHESLRRSRHLERLADVWHELLEALDARDAARARHAVRGLVCRALDDLGLAHDL
jgi:DNA-binding GntR family transcriptional regulator